MNPSVRPKVLVTGATGFLGSYVVDELLDNSYEVIAQGRNQTLLNKYKERNVPTCECDLKDIDKLRLEVDYVIHCAGLSTIWGKWKEFYESNVQGTENILKFCFNNKVKRLVFISSPSVYTSRSDRLNIEEDQVDIGNKLNSYIQSKIQAERLVNTSQTKGLETVILRPRGIIGVGDPSIVPRLLKANSTFGIPIFNSGNNLIDLTCVENVAYAIRLALESSSAKNKTFNITNDEPRRFFELTEQLFGCLNVKPKYEKRNVKMLYFVAFVLELIYKTLRISNEPPITRYSICTLGYSQTLDISQAKVDLGYSPKISLDEGIKKYGAHIRSDAY